MINTLHTGLIHFKPEICSRLPMGIVTDDKVSDHDNPGTRYMLPLVFPPIHKILLSTRQND